MVLPCQNKIMVLLGDKIRCQVTCLSTIRDVKAHVHCYEGIPVDKQVLSFWGQVRDDAATVGELALKAGDVLNLYLKYEDSPNEVTLISKLTVREG